MGNTAKSLDILAINFLHNYFDGNKIIFRSVSNKIFKYYTLAKSFFPCSYSFPFYQFYSIHDTVVIFEIVIWNNRLLKETIYVDCSIDSRTSLFLKMHLCGSRIKCIAILVRSQFPQDVLFKST